MISKSKLKFLLEKHNVEWADLPAFSSYARVMSDENWEKLIIGISKAKRIKQGNIKMTWWAKLIPKNILKFIVNLTSK
jgi:hypothetical protein